MKIRVNLVLLSIFAGFFGGGIVLLVGLDGDSTSADKIFALCVTVLSFVLWGMIVDKINVILRD